jgi:AAA+ ATPase superfamily predicted ATPase
MQLWWRDTPLDPSALIDREREQGELRDLLDRPGPSMAVLYGRRRVGKTFLLQHTFPPRRLFHFTASDATPELNRRALLEAVSRWTGSDIRMQDFPTWRRVFELILQLGGDEPVVVVLDEYQYLHGGHDENIDSALAAVWESHVNRRPKGRPFLLVLCGSIIRVMERLDGAENPLYGRLDWKGRLDPFDYFDTARMATFRQPRDRALAYGIYGGTPRYLATIDTNKTLPQNVVRSVLSPNGNVRIQVETAIAQEHGLRELSEYNAILSAIGLGATQRNEIAMQTGLAQTFAFRTRLEKLVELGLIEATRNFGASASEPYRYRVSDPALRFYYGVVTRYRSELELDDPMEIWRKHIVEELDAYMGLVFERVAQQAYVRLRPAMEFPIVREWGRWEGLDRDRRQTEIDIVARRTDGAMLTGAVKWSAKPVGISLHDKHLDMLTRLSQSGYAWAREALAPGAMFLYVAANGFAPGFLQHAEAAGVRVIAWSLEELYSPEGNG